MKKITFFILIGILGIVNVANARWVSSMNAVKVYNYSLKADCSISVSSGSIGLGGGSVEATLVGISYECGWALSSCDESKQTFVKVS